VLPANACKSGQLFLKAALKEAIGAPGAELRSALRRIQIAEAATGLGLLPQPVVTVSMSFRCALKS